MRKIQYLLSDSSGHSNIRFLNFAKYCGRDLLKSNIHLSWSKEVNWDSLKDTYIFSGIIRPDAWKVVQKIKELGSKIVWQVDDDLFNMTDSNPSKMDYTTSEVMKKCYKIVDSFYCSTEKIKKELLSQYDKPTFVCKNLVEDVPFEKERNPKHHLYTGGGSHDGDMDDFVHYYNDHVDNDYYFLGLIPSELCEYSRVENEIVERPKFCNTHRIVTIFDCSYFEYSQYLNVFDELDCGVGHVSVAKNQFNKYKSNLKILEYGIRGIDVISSRWDCYTEDNISDLITYYGDPFVSHSTELRNYILLNYCWSNEICRSNWLNNFEEMCK